MITLAGTNTLVAVASAASAVTLTVFGTEITGNTEVSKVLYQNQIPASATTIYTAPVGAVTLIKSITAVNLKNSNTTFQLFVNGTTTNTAMSTATSLPPFTMANYDDMAWIIRGQEGQILTENFNQLREANYTAGCFAETFDRNYCTEVNVGALVSGRLTLQAIWLTAGQVINWISFYSATTAAGTPTNQLFGLYDSSRNLLATTSNDTTTAWGATTLKQLKLTSPYTVTTTGLYYVGVMVTATTVPTLKGPTALADTQLHGASPILNGASSTGLTTSLPNPAAAITVATTLIWGAVG
jgi:hypothetical protein